METKSKLKLISGQPLNPIMTPPLPATSSSKTTQNKTQFLLEEFLDKLGYENPKELGAGVYGTVFQVMRKSDGKQVAVKLMNVKRSNYAELLKEIYVLKYLSKHSNFLLPSNHVLFFPASSIYAKSAPSDLSKYMGVLIETPLMSSDLHTALPTLSMEEFIRLFYELLCGINVLHRLGVIHADLKPQNILVADDGKSKKLYVSDFGLTQMINSLWGRTHQEVLTPGYRAPEVICNPIFPAINPAIDAWSLGIILLEGIAVIYTRDQIKQEIASKKTSSIKPFNEIWEGPWYYNQPIDDELGGLACLLRLKSALKWKGDSDLCYSTKRPIASRKQTTKRQTQGYLRQLVQTCLSDLFLKREYFDERKQSAEDGRQLIEDLTGVIIQPKDVAKYKLLLEIVSGLLRGDIQARMTIPEAILWLQTEYGKILEDVDDCGFQTTKTQNVSSFSFNPSLYISEPKTIEGTFGDPDLETRYSKELKDSTLYDLLASLFSKNQSIYEKKELVNTSLLDDFKQAETVPQLSEIIRVYKDIINQQKLGGTKELRAALLVSGMIRWGGDFSKLLYVTDPKDLGFDDQQEMYQEIDKIVSRL